MDGQGGRQEDGTRAHGEEADEDAGQHNHDHQEDEEGGLGIDLCPHQTHKQAEEEDAGGIEQRPPIPSWQHLEGTRWAHPIWSGKEWMVVNRLKGVGG